MQHLVEVPLPPNETRYGGELRGKQSILQHEFSSLLHTSPVVVAVSSVIDLQRTAIYALLLQNFFGLLCTLDVGEVCVCETSGLARTAVDRDSDV